jgi:transposase InsO family protein
MRHHLAVFGPAIGARELKAEFPDASWWECETIAWRFRHDLRRLVHSCTMLSCTWTTPGTVWAADVWQPAQPIEGIYGYVLDVRDLGSGCIIESMPLERCTAQAVSATIERLYATYGAPLVLKTDNGSEFTGDGAPDLHRRWGVQQLLSPPYLPSYNGACEAGHGSIRYRAEMLARRDGCPGQWTLNHLEGGRCWANDLTSQEGGVTHGDQFAHRAPISQEQRDQFVRIVQLEWSQRWHDLSIAAEKQRRTIVLTNVQATVSRAAISAALRDLGYLTTRSVPIRQPIPYAKASDISL